MRITITARHCEIPPPLRDRARRVLERLGRVAPRPLEAQVLFSSDHGAATVQLGLRVGRGHLRVGASSGADHRSALDRAVAKLRRQLDKPPASRRSARGSR